MKHLTPYFRGVLLVLATLAFIIVMITITSEAQASDDFETFALLGSHHTNDQDYCEFNPGLGISFPNTLGKTTSIMAYKNSECTLSVMASMSNPIGNSSFHWSIGGALGYDYSPIVPFAAITYHHEYFFIGATPLFQSNDNNIELDGYVFFYGVKL